ncbi:EKC/KEOPS complex subunit Tprkb isoform X4 [Helianthus annuus]|uniref:EKC/KEOPS complex subunit Tprkb isoform X4 n=1 Tax=Helianthus annuus TaxID=4232 RepID=UPI001652CB35|nr:EKC/KEOPS complex subunit Tprkb isoform X4 [Helianthus annuus]
MKVYELSGTTLSVALFTDVANSKYYFCTLFFRLNLCVIETLILARELLELMQAGTLEPEVALLNASLIPDIFPVLAAAHKTLVAKSRDSLTTRTLHSELVYNYSGSKHISESLKRCGISDSTTYILVARFGALEEEVTSSCRLYECVFDHQSCDDLLFL